jgi:hypothetical protein
MELTDINQEALFVRCQAEKKLKILKTARQLDM